VIICLKLLNITVREQQFPTRKEVMKYWTVSEVYEKDGWWWFDGPTKYGEMVPYGPWNTKKVAEDKALNIKLSVVGRHNFKVSDYLSKQS
jgi:hypothetical protein